MITRHTRFALALFISGLSLAAPSVASLAAPSPVSPASPSNAEPTKKADERRNRQNRQRQRVNRARESRAQGLRRVMSSLGFEERALQDEVLRYIGTEVSARNQVRRKAQEIYAALRDAGASEAQVRALLDQYQAVIEADRTRRRQAEDALNERIGFRNKPRLEAMLTLFGIIGDAPIVLPANTRAPR